MENQLSIIPKYLICVDEAFRGLISGRLFCGCLPQGVPFCGIEELVIMMDVIMDRIAFPQSTVDKRAFASTKNTKKRVSAPPKKEELLAMRTFSPGAEHGRKATFTVQVQFRQNATWQGVVEGTGVQHREFKSELELMLILDMACAEAEAIATAK
ncbi:MAG: hypothetical protein K6F52_02705 [Clostridia bacterium]|nr:hypothetical protein [Clostridia bacterium]